MCSELECGVCYLTFNAGRRCPRELHCKHSFCESCLLVLARPVGSGEAPEGEDRSVVCPLCRRTTSISGEDKLRAELRVDECVLERLLAAGVLGREDEGEMDQEGEGDGQTRGQCEEDERAAPSEASDEESVSSSATRGGSLRRSLRKVWRKISGKKSSGQGGENCMTDAELRSMAMMACYMF